MREEPTVFLSYAQEDRSDVDGIYAKLKNEGLNPWLDHESILPGETWSSSIERAIRNADFVLAVISRHSVSKRGFLHREIRAALEILDARPPGAVFLVPVRLDESEPPAALKHIQYVDLFKPDGWSRLLLVLRQHKTSSPTDRSVIHELRNELVGPGEETGASKRPQIFVAMPFEVGMEDVYYYGILRALSANGFRGLRIDKTAFTGDILDQIKAAIQTSSAAVVDLSGSNPNVYLELGYAWGCGIPTVLVIRDGDEPSFDVRGQKRLTYRTIKELEVA